MSGFFRVQVNIPLDSGTPEDEIVNVWHFDSDQSFADDADDVVARLATFYQAIDGVVFPAAVASPARVKVYDLADPEVRAPGYESTIALTPAVGSSFIPNEVAICLSMAGAQVSGEPIARRRGRIFLGPVTQTALELVGARVRINAATRTAITNAALALATGPDPGDARLAVFSPTTYAAGGSSPAALDDAFTDVVRIWVDNAPDTVRSRGEVADARTTVLVP